jgi:hypothetical protein
VVVLLVVTFFYVVLSGPAGIEYLERRRKRLDAPRARVMYLPSGRCRGSEPLE